MTDQRRVVFVLAVLLVSSLVAPVVAMGAVAQPETATPTPTPTAAENDTQQRDEASRIPVQGAVLSVRQPSYTDSTADRDGSSSKPVYRVQGDEHLLGPQNFDADSVVYFGVETANGSLEYDPEFGLYVFHPEGHTGSFDVYWETDSVRYEAVIRVTDQSDVTVVDPAAYQQDQEDAGKWRHWNATLDELYHEMPLAWKLFGAPDRQALLQGMVNTYIASRDPGRWLTGTFFGAVVVIFLSLGGLLFYIMSQAGPGWVIYKLKRRLHWHETTEAFEGEITDRQLKLEQRERERILGNVDYNAIPGFNDHIAAAFRDHLGDDVLEGYNRLRAATGMDAHIKDRLRAMGQNRYAARRIVTDGGGETSDDELRNAVSRIEDDESVTYELVDLDDVLGPDEDMTDHDDLVTLNDPSDRLIDDVRDSELLWRDFDFLDADLDYSAFEEPLESCDLESIIEKLDPPMHYFDHELEYGEHLLQFARYVEEHPYTDDNGSVNTFRAFVNLLIRQERWLGDVHGVPGATARADALERAVLDYDLGERADKYVEDLREAKIER